MVTTFGYARRRVALDLLVLAAVPALLVGVHVLASPAARFELVLQHGDPSATEFLTAAYVHASDVHLRNNVVGYVAGSLMAYLLCLEAGRRRWFHVTFATLLLALPVLVNVASHLAVGVQFPGQAAATQGFSAVVASIGGFVYVALLVLLATRYSRSTATFVGAAVFLVLLTTFYVVHADVVDPALLALVVGSGLLCIAAMAADAPRRVPTAPADWRSVTGEAIPVLLVASLLAAFVIGLFPEEIVRDGLVVNVYAHAIGFLLGAGFAGLLEPIVEG